MPIAALVARQLLGNITDLAWQPFRPDRFSPTLKPADSIGQHSDPHSKENP